MTDRIEKKIVLGAARSRVWRALSAVDPAADYSSEPATLVTFTLEDAGRGTLLTIVESGFDQIPLHRRAEAMRMNDGGWAEQTKNIERHVTASR